MSRPNAPFYRVQKDGWYGRIRGRVLSLGVRGRGNRKAALEEYARLLIGEPRAATPPPPPPPPPPSTTAPSVRGVVDDFLVDAARRVTPGCLRNYRLYLSPFADAFAKTPADTLTATVVEEYARRQREWSDTYRSNFLAAVTTCLRRAVRRRLLKENPLPPLDRPPRASRGAEATVTAEEYAALLNHTNPLFRDLLTLLWTTGARPGEIAGLTAEMVNASADGVIPLRQHKTAHKGKSRLLILTGEAWEIAKRRAAAVGTGLLFRGQRGLLTSKAINNRLDWLCQKAGVRKIIPYAFRHSFATDALTKGIPDATVAALLGHCGTGMLHKHYSHLTARTRVLAEAARVVRGSGA